jgi:hypothetical protein
MFREMEKATWEISSEVSVEQHCIDCKFWRGRCYLGKTGRVAISPACSKFKIRRM